MSIFLDIFLVILLSMAICYGFALNRRIMALRKDQKNLDKLATKFAKATVRAEQSIYELKSTTDRATHALGETVQSADSIRDDLNYLIERGNRLADVLEKEIRQTEKKKMPENGSRNGNPETIVGTTARGNSVHSEAERELIRALQAVR